MRSKLIIADACAVKTTQTSVRSSAAYDHSGVAVFAVRTIGAILASCAIITVRSGFTVVAGRVSATQQCE